MLGYIKTYGTYTFAERPLNDVDSLIFCQLSYLKFDGMVSLVTERKKAVSLQSIKAHPDYEKLYADTRFEKENRALFEAMLSSRRFRKVRLNCYLSLTEPGWESQFAAVTCFYEKESMYLAFRGTDETLVGWKEDFNMAFQNPIPSQLCAKKYLQLVAGRYPQSLYLGGHSKGGNLAIYAALKAEEEIQERILHIYSMDGPGFRKEVLKELKYENISEKITKIVPRSSLVGMMFEEGICKIVESSNFGLMQHDAFSWLTKDGDFLYAPKLNRSRRASDNVLNQWVLSLTKMERKLLVDSLYKMFSLSPTETLLDFTASLKRRIVHIFRITKDTDKQTKKALKHMVKGFFSILWRWVWYNSQ